MITNLNNSVHVAYAFLTCCMKKDIEVSGGISTKLNVLHCIFIALFYFLIWDAQNINSVHLAEKLWYEFNHEYVAYEVV